MKKILLIKLGGIGDMIFFTPVIRAVRNYYKQSKITVMLESKAAASVITGSGLIDEFVYHKTENENPKNIFKFLKFIYKLRKEKFDISISSYPGKSFKASLMAGLINARQRVGFNFKNKGLFYNVKVDLDENKHIRDKNIDLLKALGIEVNDKKYFFYLDEKVRAETFDILTKNKVDKGEKYLTIHCSSTIDHWGKSKQWPVKKYFELMRMLLEKFADIKIVLIGDKKENFECFLNELSDQHFNDRFIDLTGKTKIKQLGWVLKNSVLFIGNDSGPLHIAAAVDIPTVSIWGATDPDKAAPIGKKDLRIYKEMPCRPCSSIDKVECFNYNCLSKIAVQKVFNEIIDFITKHNILLDFS